MKTYLKYIFLFLIALFFFNFSYAQSKIEIHGTIATETIRNFQKGCNIIYGDVKESKLVNSITNQIIDDLLNFKRGEIIINADGYDEKFTWIINQSTTHLIDVQMETNSKWVGKLVLQYFAAFQKSKCLVWEYLGITKDKKNWFNFEHKFELYSKDKNKMCEIENIWKKNSFSVLNSPTLFTPTIKGQLSRNLFNGLPEVHNFETHLKNALASCGYSANKLGINELNKGFELITEIEQFNASDLTPKKNPEDRWSLKISPEIKSMKDYLTSIFLGNKGYYRMFIFKITDSEHRPVEEADFAGIQTIPSQTTRTISEGKRNENATSYQVFVWVYEFEKTESGKAVFKKSSTWSLNEYLAKAKIMKALKP